MNSRVQTLIASLQLQPHPEGGYYREIFRSDHLVAADQDRAERKALTAIYFLLEAGQHSRWHRVLSDEVWSYLEGEVLELLCFDLSAGSGQAPAASQLTISRLGPLAPETEPVLVVPAGVWQAARPLGAYTLVGCSVGPGFEFGDFSMAADHPDAAERIRTFGDAFTKLI